MSQEKYIGMLQMKIFHIDANRDGGDHFSRFWGQKGDSD